MTKLLQVTDNFSTMRSEKTSVKTCLVRILERVCFIEKKRNEKHDKTADDNIAYFFGTAEGPLVMCSS